MSISPDNIVWAGAIVFSVFGFLLAEIRSELKKLNENIKSSSNYKSMLSEKLQDIYSKLLSIQINTESLYKAEFKRSEEKGIFDDAFDTLKTHKFTDKSQNEK